MIDQKIEKFFSLQILAIFCLIIISLGLRIYFTRFEFPLESQDALLYLLEAKQISTGNFYGIPTNFGWQAFLSFFGNFLPLEANQSGMTVIRIISISVSLVTIPVVYRLGRTIMNKEFSLLAAAFFAFDPNLIENSIFGITEPIFIFCGLLTILFLLRRDTLGIILASVFAGLAFDVRLTGIVLFILVLITIFSRKDIKIISKQVILFLLVFAISSSPYFIQTYIQYGNPFAIINEVEEEVFSNVPPSMEATKINSDLSERLFFGVTEEFKHIFRISIPYLVLFVPFGLFLMLSNLDFNKKIIIIAIIISLIIAIPQYLWSLEYRNLFFILPLFSTIAAYGLQKILNEKNNKNLFIVLLMAGMILLSYNMLRERYDVDYQLLEEKEIFGKYAANSLKGIIMGDLYNFIQHNIPDARYGIGIGGHVRNDDIGVVGFGPPTNSPNDLIDYIKNEKITHIVIDDNFDARSPELIEIYVNENNYPFLNKVFDSEDEGYIKLRVKVFEIDHNKLE